MKIKDILFDLGLYGFKWLPWSKRSEFAGYEIRKEDVYMCSYPRSGNTWTRMVVGLLLYPESPEIDLDLLDEMIPDAGARLVEGRTHRVFKDHRPSFDLFPKVIYNVRNGRDSIVSAYHYAVQSLGFEGSFDEYLFNRKPQPFGFWHEHVREAIRFAESYPSRIIFVKYEDLSFDFVGTVKTIAAFLGVKVSEAQIEKIREKTDFSVQQSKAQKSDDKRKRHTIKL